MEKFEVLKGADSMWLPLAKYMVHDSNKRQGYDWFMFPEAIMDSEMNFYKTSELQFHIHIQRGSYTGYSGNSRTPDLRWLEANKDNKRIRLELCYAAKIVKDE